MHTSTLQITVASNQRTLRTVVADANAGRTGSYKIQHTKHSKKRASQRGIKDELIPLVLEFGELFLRQGMRFYAVARKHLPRFMDHELREKLNNLVVVMSGDTNEIITCYKADNAIRHVQRKASYLS